MRQSGISAGGSFVTVKGLKVTHVATSYGDAAFGFGGNDLTLDSNIAEWNNLDGFHVSATRAKIVKNTARFNGGPGISGGFQSSVVEDNVTDNNSWRFGPGWHDGGMKIVGGGPSDNVIRRHTSRNNNGPGIWIDTDCHRNRIENSYFDNNVYAGILLEACSDSNVVVNNVVTRSRVWPGHTRETGGGIMLSTAQGVQIYNNTLWGNDNYGDPDLWLAARFVVAERYADRE